MCVGMYVSSRLVLTPVVPPRPEASVWHPGFRPVETTFRETLRNLRLNYRRGPLAIEPRDETLCAIYWPTHAYNPLPFISPLPRERIWQTEFYARLKMHRVYIRSLRNYCIFRRGDKKALEHGLAALIFNLKFDL